MPYMIFGVSTVEAAARKAWGGRAYIVVAVHTE